MKQLPDVCFAFRTDTEMTVDPGLRRSKFNAKRIRREQVTDSKQNAKPLFATGNLDCCQVATTTLEIVSIAGIRH